MTALFFAWAGIPVGGRQLRGPNGELLDPNTFKPLAEKPDLGHKYGEEYWRERDAATEEALTQGQFNDRMNNPDLYQYEDPSSNRSHCYEKPR
ncbi:MAG: HNH/ENDO VII family nuclease [Phycisphaerales bacterium]|nr:HNH/ENDO VII family nuclease [Phycisphaerales bacterium]